MLRIGLTGGIASGKTAVADCFARLGATVVDTDVIARAVVEPGEPGFTAVVDAFGPGILQADGRLDRARLRDLVFRDPARRHLLESLLHPLIRSRALAMAEAAAGPYAVMVVPLLVETGFATLVDRVLVVDCPEAVQLERLMDRDGMDRAAAQRMLAAQTGRAARLAAADDVISNTGTLAELEEAVSALHTRYLQAARTAHRRMPQPDPE